MSELEFTPLTGVKKVPRSVGRKASIFIELKGADTLRVKAGEDGTLKVSGEFSTTAVFDAAVEKQRAFDLDIAAGVDETAIAEGCVPVIHAVIQRDSLVVKVTHHGAHDSAPVDVRTTTVAGGGEAASLSPEGRECADLEPAR